MRTHRNRAAFQCWRNPNLLREVVSAETLQVARMEPAIRHMHAGVGLDLVFARNGRFAVVPFVNVESTMLAEREKSAVIWPAMIAETVGQAALEAIEAQVVPWMEALSLGRACNDETIRRFGNDSEAWKMFERAREFGFLGAAPYRRVLSDVAPYFYAVRFAAGATIAIDDAGGGSGAAILARSARMVRANLGSAERNDAACRWFGAPLFTADLPEADVRIGADASMATSARVRISTKEGLPDALRVSVATPVPYDVMVSFDTDDAPEVYAFHVDATAEVPLRRPIGADIPAATGGSAGNILLMLRDDWRQAPDSDVDDACELARRLGAEGFTVEISGTSEHIDVSAYDLVHAFALPHAGKMLPHLRAAASKGIPLVMTAALEDVTADATWGIGLSNLIYKNSTDEETLADHLQLFSERRLETELFSPKGQAPYPGYESDVREALSLTNAVLTCGPAEERFLRERFAYGGYVAPVAPFVNVSAKPARTEALAGTGSFVLGHAPIHARGNQLLLARAAMAAKLPLVLLGPVADVEAYMLLRQIADEHVVLIPSASPEEIEALYRRARVFADVSWAQYGLHRIARAALSGAALVVSNRRYAAELWRPGLWLADPASVEAMTSALGDAWQAAAEARGPVDDCARRVAAACDPTAALVGTVTAYAAASEAARLNYARS